MSIIPMQTFSGLCKSPSRRFPPVVTLSVKDSLTKNKRGSVIIENDVVKAGKVRG